MMELVITVCLVCKTSLEKNNMYERNKKVKEKEEARLKELKKIDKDFFDRGIKYVAGIDEAGRGPLAGPVVVAAVIMKPDSMIEGINDSKKISEKKREKLYDLILDEAISYGIGIVDQKEIDEINILRASFLAMHRAVDQLTTRPQHLLIDGNRFTKYPGIPHTTVVKGDGKYLSIAAASILAKTYRDDYMNRLHEEFPYYDWDHNKGYPTKKHRAAIAERGTTPYHRMTFNLLGDGQLTLNF